jgi:hypothetical protein
MSPRNSLKKNVARAVPRISRMLSVNSFMKFFSFTMDVQNVKMNVKTIAIVMEATKAYKIFLNRK